MSNNAITNEQFVLHLDKFFFWYNWAFKISLHAVMYGSIVLLCIKRAHTFYAKIKRPRFPPPLYTPIGIEERERKEDLSLTKSFFFPFWFNLFVVECRRTLWWFGNLIKYCYIDWISPMLSIKILFTQITKSEVNIFY